MFEVDVLLNRYFINSDLLIKAGPNFLSRRDEIFIAELAFSFKVALGLRPHRGKTC